MALGKAITRAKRQTWLLMLGLCLALPSSGQAQSERALRIAVEGAFPPFNYIDQANELQGFEVDLARAFCEAMRTACTLVQHDWDGIIRGLINREYDAVMSSLAITERRQKRIAFSRRYYLMPATFIAPKAAEMPQISPEALSGKRIGTVDRSEHAEYLASRFKDAQVQLYAKIEEAILDLQADRLDLVLGDKLHLSRFLDGQQGECCRFIADVSADPTYRVRAVGVGLRKEDEDLKARFDEAIETVMANGTYDRIRAKYFPFDVR